MGNPDIYIFENIYFWLRILTIVKDNKTKVKGKEKRRKKIFKEVASNLLFNKYKQEEVIYLT